MHSIGTNGALGSNYGVRITLRDSVSKIIDASLSQRLTGKSNPQNLCGS
jgi:hypothetical protein